MTLHSPRYYTITNYHTHTHTHTHIQQTERNRVTEREKGTISIKWIPQNKLSNDIPRHCSQFTTVSANEGFDWARSGRLEWSGEHPTWGAAPAERCREGQRTRTWWGWHCLQRRTYTIHVHVHAYKDMYMNNQVHSAPQAQKEREQRRKKEYIL